MIYMPWQIAVFFRIPNNNGVHWRLHLYHGFTLFSLKISINYCQESDYKMNQLKRMAPPLQNKHAISHEMTLTWGLFSKTT